MCLLEKDLNLGALAAVRAAVPFSNSEPTTSTLTNSDVVVVEPRAVAILAAP